jgi:hypothetical protein
LSDPDAVVERLRPFDVVCVMRERTPLTGAMLEQLPDLKLISSTGPRNASIDVAAARARGITVCNTGYNSNGAMELTWALILALVRNIPSEVASFREGGWQVSVGGDLHLKTMGIVGLGRIGGRMAKVARAFGMEVITWSQNLTRERAEEQGARLVVMGGFAGAQYIFQNGGSLGVLPPRAERGGQRLPAAGGGKAVRSGGALRNGDRAPRILFRPAGIAAAAIQLRQVVERHGGLERGRAGGVLEHFQRGETEFFGLTEARLRTVDRGQVAHRDGDIHGCCGGFALPCL